MGAHRAGTFPDVFDVPRFQFDVDDCVGRRCLAADSCAHYGAGFCRSGARADYLPHSGVHDSESYPAQVSATLVLPTRRTCSHVAHQSLVFAGGPHYVGHGSDLVDRVAAFSEADFGAGGGGPKACFYLAQILRTNASSCAGLYLSENSEPRPSDVDLGGARDEDAYQRRGCADLVRADVQE